MHAEILRSACNNCRNRRDCKRMAGAAVSNLLEPADIGLGKCAACDHNFKRGEPYHRGIAKGTAGVLLYIVCARCARHLLKNQDAAEKFSDSLLASLNTAALAEMPAGGSA